jgi:type IV pilus biogenesis protein CpaD/CtpE
MTHVRLQFQSPLALIRQWQQRADGARLLEVLITGYTLDLPFFEKRCVSMARGLGARITVLADVHQAVHDPADVRHAGVSYQHASVSCRGAFHPKLAVLVGEDEVWLAIGSGNPTTSGWGHNEELWLVLRSSRHRGPVALNQLADWLRALHLYVAMPSWIASTVAEVADMITPEVTDDTHPTLRVLGNLGRPLIDQLPSEPVDLLKLAAPFFDPASAAVRELASRFRPSELVIGLQPTLSSYSGSTLADAVARVGRAEVRDLPEADGRLSHGKLVEWTVDGTSTAMAGSPNLSYAALLASTNQCGNCELAAVFSVDQTIFPEGENVALETLRSRSTMPAQTERRLVAPVMLLGARRSEDGITVELLADTPTDVIIETSPSGGPGTWQRCHVFRPPVHASHEVLVTQFQVPAQMGAAVRAVVNELAQQYISPAVFLTDTARCLARQVASSAPRLGQHFGDVFSDQKLQHRFESDLLRLLSENAAHRTQEAYSRPTRRVTAATSTTDRWTLWLQGTEATIGPNLTASLFPFTSVMNTPTAARLQQWDVDLGGPTEDIAEDEDPESVDPISDGDEVEAGRQPPVVPATMHRKMRSFAEKLALKSKCNPCPSTELRMLVVQLILDLLAAGVWGPDDETWRTSLADAIIALPPTDDEAVPDRALDFLGSLAAVGLALLNQDASLSGGRESDLSFRRAWEAIRLHAALAEPDLSEQYLYRPAQGYSRVAGLAGVHAIIALAQDHENDPDAAVRTAIDQVADEKGWAVEFDDGVWLISAERASPRVVAGKIASVLGGESVTACAIFVKTDRGKCAVLRNGQTLCIAENKGWKLVRMPFSSSSPTSQLNGEPVSGKAFPLSNPPEAVTNLADELEVELERVERFL